MLVLSRRVGEEICIADNIVIRVTKITFNGKVQLAIDAPRNVEIRREEVPKIEKKK